MSLAELHRQALASRAKILKELEEEVAAEEKRLKEVIKTIRNAEQVAKNAEKAARNAIRSAKASMKSIKTRKRAPGANYEIAGKPAHLAPGVHLRRVEGTRRHSQTLALTRGKRSKAKY